jgi:hypothetical protein
MSNKRPQLGDIFRIPLPNGKSAFGRLHKEGALGIYQGFYDEYSEVPEQADYVFFVGVYKNLLRDGEWEFVAKRPFPSEEDAWQSPKCIRDVITGEYSLYIKGEIFLSTEEVCKDLERVAAWDRHHVVDRLMGDMKWNPK